MPSMNLGFSVLEFTCQDLDDMQTVLSLDGADEVSYLCGKRRLLERFDHITPSKETEVSSFVFGPLVIGFIHQFFKIDARFKSVQNIVAVIPCLT